jgi:hypothetical protein
MEVLKEVLIFKKAQPLTAPTQKAGFRVPKTVL